MSREQDIREIEALFPPDSQYEDTAEIGQELLDQAKREAEDWRNESDEVLRRFAALCRQRHG